MQRHFTGRKARKWVLTNLFQQFANMADLTPLIRGIRKQTDVIRNVPYRVDGGEAHVLDVYRPKNRTGLLPVMIYIHGGGFTLCSKETHRSVALLFARFGFLVLNINYRLAPKYPYPAALEDACHAYRWAVEQVESYGGDKNRLSLAGESGFIDIKMTHQDIADRVGTSREMVSRIIKELIMGRYIIRNKKRITILKDFPENW